jgi:dTDP-6-deoxy-L-talose 4-dehydrogenase (NAD+)
VELVALWSFRHNHGASPVNDSPLAERPPKSGRSGSGRSPVLVTGAAGFVGRQIVRALLTGGHPVRALVRSRERAAAVLLSGPDPAAIEILESPDLFSESSARLRSFFSGIDTVIHAAWYVEPGDYLHSPLNFDCLRGTLALARAFAASGGRRFVGIGSCAEYGVLPAARPLSPGPRYAVCKATAFVALSEILPRAGVELVWCRLFHLHGEGEKEGRLVPYLRARLAAGLPAELRDGSQIRDELDVREAGRRIAEIALGRITGPVEIRSGVPVTIREIAEAIADEYRVDGPGARHLAREGGPVCDAAGLAG